MPNYRDLILSHPDLFDNQDAMLKIVTNSHITKEWEIKRQQNLQAEGKPREWAKIGIVYNDPFIMIIRDLIQFPDGGLNSYFRILNRADLNGGQGVVIFCEMEGRFLLLHQYRHPIRAWSYEFPRGFGEPGVSAEQQAHQEVFEEVNGSISELVDLGIYYSNTGLEANKVRLFYTRLTSIGQVAENEGIESVLWVSKVQLEEMIASAEINDGFTIAAYVRAKLRGLL